VGSWRRIIFWAVVVATFAIAAYPNPPSVPILSSDKVQHAVAFAAIGALGMWAFPKASPLKIIVALSAYGVAIELVQATKWVRRDGDVIDWLVDTFAAAIAVALVRYFRGTAAPSPDERGGSADIG